MLLWTTIIISLGVNIGLLWYLKGVLKKLLFISENLADLYFTFRAFDIYVSSLYSMNSFHGEPMIEELIHRIKDVREEIENFRDIFRIHSRHRTRGRTQ